MDEFFPRGFIPYLVGGALIGTGVVLIFWFTGIRAGASGVLTSVWSWASDRPTFAEYRGERNWRLVFTLALIVGAALVTLLYQTPFSTDVTWWRLAIGGFLVGLGTRMARGCTSGHGICGLSSLSLPSLLHVVTFMGIAIATAQVLERVAP